MSARHPKCTHCGSPAGITAALTYLRVRDEVVCSWCFREMTDTNGPRDFLDSIRNCAKVSGKGQRPAPPTAHRRRTKRGRRNP